MLRSIKNASLSSCVSQVSVAEWVSHRVWSEGRLFEVLCPDRICACVSDPRNMVSPFHIANTIVAQIQIVHFFTSFVAPTDLNPGPSFSPTAPFLLRMVTGILCTGHPRQVHLAETSIRNKRSDI